MRYFYSALLYALVPFILLRMLLRSRKAPAYCDLGPCGFCRRNPGCGTID
jgi:3-deoxy-D-manno-octulosonic-acid transferase